MKLRTIGILKKFRHPDIVFYEYRYFVWVKESLTTDWPLIQCGSDDMALEK